jgi:predicted AlkP superfamily pyrophosphatase or phosphodiesterase
MRRILCGAILGFPLIGGAQAPTPVTPTLVVMLTVDQLRSDYLPRFEKQLTGGLARLYHGGAVMTNAFHDHANSETAPGHATILSGREPWKTGIMLNELGVSDPQYPLLTGTGGASPYRFRGSVLIDWMRVKWQRSRALSISRKDRSAILPLGRAKQPAFWYGTDGRFTTSTYYADTLPDWMKQFNARRLPHKYAGQKWELLLPASEYPEPDSVRYENGGRDFLFPHTANADSTRAANGLAEFPWMDEVTLQAALAGVNAMRLGTGPDPDLLAVSLSTTDAVGHRYGPNSRELHDQILRLDRALGVFIDSLYKLRDSTRIVFALTADHGVTPYPELQPNLRPVPRWVSIAPVVTALRAKLTERGLPRSALGNDEAFIMADRAAFATARLNADSVLRVFRDSLRAVPGVARVDFVSALASADTVRDKIARRWLHAIPPDLGVELVITLDEGSQWGRTGGSATHGTPSDADTHVAMLFYGSPFKPGKYSQESRVVDIAPTLAHVLGVSPVEKLDGKALTAIFK